MSEPAYRPPAFRAIFLGIASFIILLMIFCNLSEVVKWSGAAFLFLPDKLGILQQVSQTDVQPIVMSSSSSTIEFKKIGSYQVYTNDYDLLILTDSLTTKNIEPWLRISILSTNEKVPLANITRGLRIYDTPFAKGRPIFYFEISDPGKYKLSHPARNVEIYVVPDYTTGREGELIVFFAVQIFALAYIISIPLRTIRRHNKERIRTIQGLRKSNQ